MKRVIAVFIVLLLTTGAVFSQKKDVYSVKTVVIDPGHGGAKPGAQGKRSQEKQITLSVAKKFGQLIQDNYPDVKVIYTRTTDVDISLAERAHIANRNKADLFISIHANSHPTAAPTGVETYVMGLSESKANLEVAKKENADILLEKDYKSNADYEGFDPNSPESYVMLAMFQNAFIDKSLNLAGAIQSQYRQHIKTVNRGVKQAELYVLYKTTCPSVLTEIGFISNPNEEAYMLSDEGQATIAVCLFNAFMTYKSTEEGTDRIANPVINIKGYGSAKKSDTASKTDKPAVAPAPKTDTVVAQKPAVQSSAEQQPTVEVAPPVVHTPAEKPLPSTTLPAQTQAETKPRAEAKAPVEVKPQAEAKLQAEARPQAKVQSAQPARAKTQSQVLYRVQFCTSNRNMKAGDPDLQGIRDIHVSQSGRLYLYTAGDYSTLPEARERCKKIQDSTRFKDAFVVAIYRGERISLERAAKIEKQSK